MKVAEITQNPFTMDSITDIVSDLSLIPADELKSKSRKPDLVCARNICYFFIREHVKKRHGNNRKLPNSKNKIAFAKIARHFNRHHTTILTARVTLVNMLTIDDDEYVFLYNAVKNKIESQKLTV